MSSLRPSLTDLESLGWRMVYTFLQALAGGLIATNFTDLNALEAVAVGAVAAALVPLRSFATKQLKRDSG